MIRSLLHILLHLIVPGIIAKAVFRDRWKSAWGIMALTIIVDLDHLLSDPIYEPNRCSIGFHPLHTYPAIFVYLVLTGITKTRLIGLGLLIHMALDGFDCIWMSML
ncbi:MAG: hypothetical protein JSW26_27310 [Desulfobacterales bacterium]|nr:MAG: hypothetical protein JSW26_27310 [Desulfobacterales bacterium]